MVFQNLRISIVKVHMHRESWTIYNIELSAKQCCLVSEVTLRMPQHPQETKKAFRNPLKHPLCVHKLKSYIITHSILWIECVVYLFQFLLWTFVFCERDRERERAGEMPQKRNTRTKPYDDKGNFNNRILDYLGLIRWVLCWGWVFA